MYVYVVEEEEFEGSTTIGVFSTLPLAREFANNQPHYYIVEYKVDFPEEIPVEKEVQDGAD